MPRLSALSMGGSTPRHSCWHARNVVGRPLALASTPRDGGRIARSVTTRKTVSRRSQATGTVLAVDDQEIFRPAAREPGGAADGLEMVGGGASGAEAVELAAELRPSLILLDLRMPGMDGIETARRLADGVPDSTVILVSLDEPADLPSRLARDQTLVHVRKQDLSVKKLKALWRDH